LTSCGATSDSATQSVVVQAGDAEDAVFYVTPSAPSPRAITSLDSATATVGTPFSFAVTTSGTPDPSITEKGKLPKHLSFINEKNGIATISGTVEKPRSGPPVVYNLTITATFGKGKSKGVVYQLFTLTVDPA
jgi:hypothetical protein